MGVSQTPGVQCAAATSPSPSGGRSRRAGGVQKKVAQTLRTAQAAYPHQRVRLFVQDEGRAGLKPVLMRVWAKVGQRPIAVQHRGFQWLYVYVFVEPVTGTSDFLILPTVSTAVMQVALAAFNDAVNPTGRDIIVLLLDGAGWHTSPQLTVPPTMLLVTFPPYTPELSPAEPLVGRVKRPLANRTFTTLDDVQDVLSHECQRLMASPSEVQSLTAFPWIRHALNSC
ncbi:transposase [Deinococcus koreensis]|uniref:transposase n=1 Tax=Deinococcus koreensis TaxID=2054903 RepID=UPI002434BF47|nr:transposase [Deinococcus koreensis]